MFWRSQKRRTEWLVAYSFDGGSGRIFMTTTKRELDRKLVEEFEDWLRNDAKPVVRTNLAVKNVIRLGRVA